MQRLILLLLACVPVWALQLDPTNLISPIANKPFEVKIVPVKDHDSRDLADLGADDDGCRHTTGPSEYEYYIAVCPYSYFAALTVEWDGQGRFRGALPPDMREWLIKSYNTDWQLDVGRTYSMLMQTQRSQGQFVPDRSNFVLSQDQIPVEKRYRLALQCYQKRGSPELRRAKIALSGAWALRVRLNVPLVSPMLDGANEEIAARLAKNLKPGQSFSLPVMLPLYKEIYESNSLTDEAYLIAGLSYVGLLVRDGQQKLVQETLDDMSKQLEKNDKPNGEMLRGLVRDRKRMVNEYVGFTASAAQLFIEAVNQEQVQRSRLPDTMMAIAECLRRSGTTDRDNLGRALDWYLALSRMNETQPAVRSEIRAQGKAPSVDSPFHLQLGWLADKQIERLKAADITRPEDFGGPDRKLLTTIVFEKFGTAEYVNPNWQPRKDGDQEDSRLVLQLTGQAAVDFTFRTGAWPSTLDQLWEREYLKDRNRVNRFYCPATGERLRYVQLKGDVTTVSPRTVVVATSAPVRTTSGPRFGAYLANNQVIWSPNQLQPGQTAP